MLKIEILSENKIVQPILSYLSQAKDVGNQIIRFLLDSWCVHYGMVHSGVVIEWQRDDRQSQRRVHLQSFRKLQKLHLHHSSFRECCFTNTFSQLLHLKY